MQETEQCGQAMMRYWFDYGRRVMTDPDLWDMEIRIFGIWRSGDGQGGVPPSGQQMSSNDYPEQNSRRQRPASQSITHHLGSSSRLCIVIHPCLMYHQGQLIAIRLPHFHFSAKECVSFCLGSSPILSFLHVAQ